MSSVLDRVVAGGPTAGAELPAPGAAWDALWPDVIDERVEALVGLAAAPLPADDPRRIMALDAWAARMQSCVQLERVLLETVAQIDALGAEFRVLKGTAVAHLDYPDPSWRGFGDVDLLVRAEDYDRIVDGLAATAGTRRRSAEARPGFDRRYGKGVCLIRPDGAQIDLHRTLATGPFGMTIAPEDLFGPPERFPVGGVFLPALGRELRFLHAALHAVLGDSPPRAGALRDVAQLGARPDLDLDAVLATAERWRVRGVVALAVTEAARRFGGDPGPLTDWVERYRPSRFEARALAAYVGPDRSYARQMAAAVRALPGVRARADYVWTMLRPDAGYVGARDGSYGARLRRAVAVRPGGRGAR